MRNIFAVIAITLTALLFTTLFSLGLGMVQVSEEQTMRRIGTWAHAGLKSVTMEEYQKLISHPLVKDSSYDIRIAIAKNKELVKRQTEINYIEPKNLEFGFKELEEGRLPEKKNEIVVDTIVMDMLGLPHKIGVTVPLQFDFMSSAYNEKFIVSGWYEGDPVMGASQVYLLKAYLKEISEGYTESDFVMAARNSDSNGYGLLQANIVFNNSHNIEGKILKVIGESGYTTKEIAYGVNWGYLSEQSQNVDFMSAIIIVTAFLVMMLTGYLIIYNIFQISIISDIKFYGLLKTIGATKRQIQHLVRRQALLLSCIGIPMGLVLGYFIGKGLMPYFLQAADGLESRNFHMKANPYIFLFGAAFSLLTVVISCRKPGKIAGSVSPIEAAKYSDTQRPRRKAKRSENGAKLSKMALANMTRNKKKSLIVILSLSLSVILLTEIVTLTKSFKLDKYLENMITGDFLISSLSLLNYSSDSGLILPEDFYTEANKQEGIESSYRMYHTRGMLDHTLSEAGHKRYQELYDKNLLDIREGVMSNGDKVQNTLQNNAPIEEMRYAYDEPLIQKLKVLDGTIDLKKFETGHYVLVGAFTDSGNTYYKPGDMVELRFHGSDSKLVDIKDDKENVIESKWVNDTKRTYEVMAVVDIPAGMTERRYQLNGLYTILPVQELLENEIDAECFAATILIEDKKEAAFQSFLENYTTQIDPNTDFESKESLRGEFKTYINVINLVGGALSLVIAVIGILNFINTMLTSVITRKREFAMLQSIGLTNAQLKKMLLYEGMYYVGFTAVISLVIGSALSFSFIRALNSIILYFDYQFTISPFVAVLPTFLIIAFVVPLIAYYNAGRQSIVERLREED
jgi:putative ABC transport system permease protein